jgi:hydrogenase expression/formation protein HypE
LAVNGTVKELAMSGARPLYLSAAFILEEELALADLQCVVRSIATQRLSTP